MACVEIAVFVLSISICHSDPAPRQLPGRWVGTLASKIVRAEIGPGLTGAVHVEGAGDFDVIRAGESSRRVYLETDQLVFVGTMRNRSIVGRVYRGREELPFELHRE